MARLEFALPPLDDRARRRAIAEDWHLELLDPEDPDERALLIRLAHPDLDEAIEQGVDELLVDGMPMNPRLHLIIHEMVATQIIDDDPPEVFDTARRLLALGRDPHEVLHMLGSVASTEIWTAMHERREFKREDLLAALAALPEAWDEQARPAPARPARQPSRAARRRRR
ncbi:MAG TPA: DUF1841 family protein [Solirubrobacteraceae bacterium]